MLYYAGYHGKGGRGRASQGDTQDKVQGYRGNMVGIRNMGLSTVVYNVEVLGTYRTGLRNKKKSNNKGTRVELGEAKQEVPPYFIREAQAADNKVRLNKVRLLRKQRTCTK